MQNTSHAVMAQRHEPSHSLDDFPTPPWAVRALAEHVLPDRISKKQSVLEPACGRGHMARTLAEYFGEVTARDISDYGYGQRQDFLATCEREAFDWVITNPPFKLAEDFIQLSLKLATRGVAMLVRTTFIESVGRYNRLFSETPPTFVAQFVERVPMVKARLDPKASTATGYCWLIWSKQEHAQSGSTKLVWIPPCRRSLEKPHDYGAPQLALI